MYLRLSVCPPRKDIVPPSAPVRYLYLLTKRWSIFGKHRDQWSIYRSRYFIISDYDGALVHGYLRISRFLSAYFFKASRMFVYLDNKKTLWCYHVRAIYEILWKWSINTACLLSLVRRCFFNIRLINYQGKAQNADLFTRISDSRWRVSAG